jgi:vancomycin permeability regulator SanA
MYLKYKFTKLLIKVFISWFLIHIICIVIDGFTDETKTVEFGIILGNKVNEDGTLSDRLKARVDKGIELYKNKIIKKIYVSGGLGKEGFKEGDKMAAYLMQQGVPKTAIVIDNNGNTTHETAENFKKDFPKQKEVIVISQYYHITRCKLAMKNVGINNAQGVHANIFELNDFFSIVREFFGYYKYLIFY